MLESFTYLDWSSLLIHLSGIIFHISLQTQLLQDVKCFIPPGGWSHFPSLLRSWSSGHQLERVKQWKNFPFPPLFDDLLITFLLRMLNIFLKAEAN